MNWALTMGLAGLAIGACCGFLAGAAVVLCLLGEPQMDFWQQEKRP